MRILLVEDDEDVARFVRRGLSEQAYAVDVATNGESALELSELTTYDAIVLDRMIPAPDGVEVCRAIRSAGSTVPILMLTARGSVDDRIAGLDAGADDYLAKPFDFGELLARLRALLRRGGATIDALLRVGTLEIDTRSHGVTIDERPLVLTTKEYAVLEYLARNAGRIVGREELAEHVWNETFDPFTNVIEVYINRLRRHIEKVSEKKVIRTVRGAGYMLTIDEEPAHE
ncbi:MAG: two-component system, OmpR family, copper resistance phosphate regulon response regulator CusR [Acidobacteriota bacterium]|jgi:two-component system copper resistance phosphate regulon response regulator CusR|nr:two-component system, OmpR family, copper resistance phosphate regulon response regulator CusR [Acidobacteriota bacterium]